jgi:hypothetical protein
MNRDDAPRTPLTSKPLPGPGDGLDRRLLDVSVDKVLVCVVLAAVAWALWLQAAIHSWVDRVPDRSHRLRYLRGSVSSRLGGNASPETGARW